MMSDNASRTLVSSFIDSLGLHWSSEDWLYWPPDIFALTSLILKSTGSYRYSVSPPLEQLWPEESQWEQDVRQNSEKWIHWVTGKEAELPDLIRRQWSVIWESGQIVAIEDLKNVSQDGGVNEEAWALIRALLGLHALSDQACSGFGLPSPGRGAVGFLANMLLAMTGSLSRIPKHRALVLPKMRTPQVGLTLRSLSHNLTLHQTEVEVIWRTMPWVNIDEETINIMVVPWPEKVEATWFRAEHHHVNRSSAEPARYFSFLGGEESRPMDDVVLMLEEAQKHVHRIHVVVFPELALTTRELSRLKNKLASKISRDRIPMIISGVRRSSEDGVGSEFGFNKVFLSTFFAGKWYDLSQSKHHRWKLDRSQIRQYNIGGVLPVNRDWWEAIEIPDRRITFLAPNGWFTLSPLICEDLARFEPVSELIRGVGPNLLIAILLDGPQLKERWSGRYASVLADDPGTSVLTVSSLGMARCSVPKNREVRNQEIILDHEDVIALWKDQDCGWKEISMGKGDGAIVLTISAGWKEEYTADGRSDGKSSAVFSLQGTRRIKIPQNGVSIPEKDWKHSEVLDTEELTIFTYLVNAALDADDALVDSLKSLATGDESDLGGGWADRLVEVQRLVLSAMKEKYRAVAEKSVAEREFKAFTEWVTGIVKSIDRKDKGAETDDGDIEYWKDLVAEARKILENLKAENYFLYGNRKVSKQLAIRVQVYSALAILWAVHQRVTTRRRRVGLNHKSANLLTSIEKLLHREYDDAWYKADPEASAKRPS